MIRFLFLVSGVVAIVLGLFLTSPASVGGGMIVGAVGCLPLFGYDKHHSQKSPHARQTRGRTEL